MIEITYVVLSVCILLLAAILIKTLIDSANIMAEMDREAQIAAARRKRMRDMDERMCKLIRAWGEARIRTIEVMGEIEINRIRKEAENELDSTRI